LQINPFNQPDVEASKLASRKLTTEYEKTGSLPKEEPFLTVDGIKFYTDEANQKALANGKSLVGCLRTHLNRLQAGDYLGLLAYVEMNDKHEKMLQAARLAVRDKKRVATCLGFGPRFLHSTGQAYKGGSNTGVFLQITADDAAICRFRGRSIPSESSRRRRRGGTSKYCRSENGALCEYTCRPMSAED
jgi:hypothetical protein